jgi:hypothetical protein
MGFADAQVLRVIMNAFVDQENLRMDNSALLAIFFVIFVAEVQAAVIHLAKLEWCS